MSFWEPYAREVREAVVQVAALGWGGRGDVGSFHRD